MPSGKKCLLIEDSRVVAKLVTDSLAAQGYDVLSSDRVESAQKSFAGERVDVIMMEMMLQGLSGANGIRAARKTFPGAGLVAMTSGGQGDGPAALLNQARAAGADAVLAKPFSPVQLKEAVGTAYWASQTKALGHVLVVDDSRVVLTIARRALEQAGFRVTTRGSMEEALEGVATLKADCVVTDIFMPGMGGIEGVAILRKLYPGIAVVAMSGGLEGKMEAQSSLSAAAKIGAAATLSKPFTDQVLVDAVNSALEKRAPTAA